MTFALGLLLSPLLLYAPGWALGRLIHTPADPLVRAYERLALSALWTGWLALTLASFGVLSLMSLAGVTAVGVVATWWFGQRQLLPQYEAPAGMKREIVIYALLLAILAVLFGRPFETVLGGRDAGVYPNTGYAIARTGGIIQYEPTVAEIGTNRSNADPTIQNAAAQAYSNFLGVQDRERFIATRFTQPGFFINEGDADQGRVVPQFFHLYSVWIAVWTLLWGLKGGLLATGYLGILATWSVAMAARTMLSGRRARYAGVLVMVLLGLNTLQIWFSRYTTSEINTQFLLWCGLWAWSSLQGLPAGNSRAALWYASITGAALGQIALTRIDFVWGLGPLAALLVWRAIRRDWDRVATAMAVAAALMLLQSVLHIVFIARSYFLDTGFAKFQDTSALLARVAIKFYTPILQEVFQTNTRSAEYYHNTPRLIAECGALAMALVLTWALWRWPRFLDRAVHAVSRWRRWLLWAAAALLIVAASYAYFIRPDRLTVQAVFNPIEERARWESYIGAPLPLPDDTPSSQLQRAVVRGNLVRLGWYLSPLGVILGVAGLVGWIIKDFNRRTWLVLVIAIAYGAFYIRDTYGTAEQTYIYIARRFLPGALPAFTLGCAWLLSLLVADHRRWLRALGAGLTGLLVLFLVATGWRAARHTEYAGTLDAVATLADAIDPEAVVLMRGGDRETPTNIATPLRYAFGRDVFVVYSNPLPYREALADQVALWQASGRPVYLLLGTNGGLVDLPGFEAVPLSLFDLQVPEWQQLQLQKPFTYGWLRFTYQLYRLEPTTQPAPEIVELGLHDFRWQHSGFYPVEEDRTGAVYAWTAMTPTLILPPRAEPSSLHLELGLGAALPPSLSDDPAIICPSLTPLNTAAGLAPLALECLAVTTQDRQTLSWDLPALDNQAGRWLLALPVRTWSPNNYAAEYPTPPNDARSLGLQWFGGRWLPRDP